MPHLYADPSHSGEPDGDGTIFLGFSITTTTDQGRVRSCRYVHLGAGGYESPYPQLLCIPMRLRTGAHANGKINLTVRQRHHLDCQTPRAYWHHALTKGRRTGRFPGTKEVARWLIAGQVLAKARTCLLQAVASSHEAATKTAPGARSATMQASRRVPTRRASNRRLVGEPCQV